MFVVVLSERVELGLELGVFSAAGRAARRRFRVRWKRSVLPWGASSLTPLSYSAHMAKRSSPILDAGLRDGDPSFDAPQRRLLIYNLRAVDFFQHPFFASRGVVANVIARDLVFESLAFRLRPIAMTDTDDSSIWSTLQTLRAMSALDVSAIEEYEARFRSWLRITDEELRPWWPTWKVDEPKTAQINADVAGGGTPVQELWDRVFGDGPHADYKRVLRNKLQDLTPEGRESRHARYGKLLATINAVYSLVVDLHNDVLTVTTGPADPNLPSFNIGRGAP